jgi:ribosomal protein S18 acetylase RimI-like enzyme
LSKELLIRKATKEDVPTILALLIDDDLSKLHEDDSLEDYENAFQTISRDANQILAVAVLNSKIVGCLQITFIPGLSRKGMWRAQIEGVRIARALRGHGLGTNMIEWAIAQCKERGCGLMQLLADKSRTEAHRFYESLGFKANHQGFRLYM